MGLLRKEKRSDGKQKISGTNFGSARGPEVSILAAKSPRMESLEKLPLRQEAEGCNLVIEKALGRNNSVAQEGGGTLGSNERGKTERGGRGTVGGVRQGARKTIKNNAKEGWTRWEGVDSEFGGTQKGGKKGIQTKREVREPLLQGK